jgi:hypothetical protein
MVHPNVNISRVDMSHVTDTKHVASLTNDIIMDATTASETIPNLDAFFYFLPYKFCMGVSLDGTCCRYLPVPFYAFQMTE